MTCSSCGYMMGPFDKNCPRCQNLPRTAPPPPPVTLPEPPAAPVAALPATMMLCPACGNSMSRKARACPQCGESFEPPTEKKVFHIILIVWATLCSFVALAATVDGITAIALSASSVALKIYAVVSVIAWLWAAMWWAIARRYGRKSQPKR